MAADDAGAPSTGTAIDPRRFRDVLGHYPTGVVVVTAIRADGTPGGLAVGTFTSVSLDPPLVAFLPAKSSTSWPAMRDAGSFCVNVLGADHQHVCQKFSSSGGDKFEGVGWQPGVSGSPVLDESLAWVDCELEAIHDAGDHEIVIGRVRDLEVRELGAGPLVFFRGQFGIVGG
ncbi:MAG: flavin reductase family protein [Patulibacter sp.]|nr:flavin reductase family protein [Patulibacter sp.]